MSHHFSNLTTSLKLWFANAAGRVVICSIARLPYVKQMAHDADTTYTEAILGVWSIVEVNLGIICGAAMRLKPLLVRWLPQLNLFSSWSRNRTKSFGSMGTSSMGLRTDPRPAQHTYQLHSVQKGSANPACDDSHIHIHRQFHVTTEHDAASRSGSDTESTGKINPPV
jgi:hypothetical protein